MSEPNANPVTRFAQAIAQARKFSVGTAAEIDPTEQQRAALETAAHNFGAHSATVAGSDPPAHFACSSGRLELPLDAKFTYWHFGAPAAHLSSHGRCRFCGSLFVVRVHG